MPPVPVVHREEEYDSRGFQTLRDMQEKHFWYRGRHRFLLHAVHRHWLGRQAPEGTCRAVDLGGGCGGWLSYFHARKRFAVSELALADSSLAALQMAAPLLPEGATRYQADLLNLQWSNRWDLVFLLDVLEHIPDDVRAMAEIHRAMAPGGLLLVTTPALQCFWTCNDELGSHQRRYSRADFRRLAAACGFEFLDARYFMFLLSPLLLASRLLAARKARHVSPDQMRGLLARMHRVPHPAVNAALGMLFAAETPLGHYIRFPWGTSVLAVLGKLPVG